MPDTRSSSKHPLPSPKKSTTIVNNDVIVISDDELPARKKPTASKKPGSSKARAKRKAPPQPIDDDIFEILTSSDDEISTMRNGETSSKVAALQNQLDKVLAVSSILLLQAMFPVLKSNVQDNKRELELAKQEAVAAKLQTDAIRRDLTQVMQENEELKAVATTNNLKSKLALACVLSNWSGHMGLNFCLQNLEDSINCEICTLKLWSPFMCVLDTCISCYDSATNNMYLYSLPECGHVFCMSCLQDWFSTTLAQHMTAHPNYVLNPPIPAHLRQIAMQARVGNNPHLQMQLELQVAQYRIMQNAPRPVYSCPTCRETVKNKPVEVFALKSVVRTISNAIGESSPKKEPVRGNMRAATGPWDGYFPTELAL